MGIKSESQSTRQRPNLKLQSFGEYQILLQISSPRIDHTLYGTSHISTSRYNAHTYIYTSDYLQVPRTAPGCYAILRQSSTDRIKWELSKSLANMRPPLKLLRPLTKFFSIILGEEALTACCLGDIMPSVTATIDLPVPEMIAAAWKKWVRLLRRTITTFFVIFVGDQPSLPIELCALDVQSRVHGPRVRYFVITRAIPNGKWKDERNREFSLQQEVSP